MRELIVTVGLPKSGKSTWCAERHLPVVAEAACRLQELTVMRVLDVMACSGNRRLILDADSSLSGEYREYLVDEWMRHDDAVVTFAFFPAPVRICESRGASLRGVEFDDFRAQEIERTMLVSTVELVLESGRVVSMVRPQVRPVGVPYFFESPVLLSGGAAYAPSSAIAVRVDGIAYPDLVQHVDRATRTLEDRKLIAPLCRGLGIAEGK
jgi:hypothetical protein